MKLGYKKLGDYIQLVDERNRNLEVETLLGVSIRKVLMPSIANTIGTDMSTYKIIRKNQFAYGTVTSRNGDKISIALLKDFDKTLISQIYLVFEIIDESLLLPDYLMMWFTRPEFDRYARFKSHGSARETFDWAEMLETELPIPSPEKQKELIEEYEAVENRIQLNKKLCATLEETAQTIYKHWFEDFEFPDKNGKPYLSSGGEMVECEELGKEIPKRWRVGKLEDFVTITRGASPRPIEKFITNDLNDFNWIKISDATNTTSVFIDNTVQHISFEGAKKAGKVYKGELILSNSASPGLPRILNIDARVHDGWLIFRNYKSITKEFLIELLKYNKRNFISEGNGSIFTNLKTEILKSFLFVFEDEIIKEFTKTNIIILKKLNSLNFQTQKLEEFKSLLLGKMAIDN